MKISDFNILILVFLMSGVMCLFSNSEVHAQNNARREFKFHQENIRSKKRNNDLQKARRAKGQSKNINNENLKIIFSNGNSSTSENDEITVKLRTNNIQLIYDWYGVSLFNYSGSNFVNDKLQKEFKVNEVLLLLGFGETLNFNFGISIYSEGKATQIEQSFENKKYKVQSKDVKIERGFGSSISLNLKIKTFLVSVTRNANKFKFKDYTCNEESCENENIDLVNDYGSTTNSFLIGFGYNF